MSKNVSVIIVTYNAEKTIQRCIDSVLSQTLADIEFIIIDGQSTDNTCNLIAKHSQHITYWISEPDLGIYDAMNKGIDHACGEWILFLGADDQIHKSETLSNILSGQNNACDFIAGDIVYDTGKRFHSRFNKEMYFRNTLHHQGVLYNRRVFSNFRYNPEHKISGDYELNLKLYLDGAPHRITKKIISACASAGASHQINPSGYKEEMLIRNKLLSTHKIASTILNGLTQIRLLVKTIL
ncbi:MAG: glycosyltransferase family 2 protein, partial [Mariprofundaceae bacterium]